MHLIEAKLKERGLTKAEVERQLGLPERALGKIIRGERRLQYADAVTLAPVLGVTPEELLDGPLGLQESEAIYIPEPEMDDLEVRLATLLYRKGRADTMVVGQPSLILKGLLPGDRILVDQHAKPAKGDLIVVQVRDEELAAAETVLRVFQPPFLVASALQGNFPPFSTDDPRIDIMGVIVGSYRHRDRAA